jgi:hypothetical protein
MMGEIPGGDTRYPATIKAVQVSVADGRTAPVREKRDRYQIGKKYPTHTEIPRGVNISRTNTTAIRTTATTSARP